MSVLAQDDGAILLGAKTALGAAAGAALVLALAARPWRGRAAPMAASGPPLALAVAAAVGFGMSRGLPAFPPAQTLHWLFYAALVGGAHGAFEALHGRRVTLLRAALSVSLAVVLLEFQRGHWGRVEGWLWSAGLAVLLFASWNGLAALESTAEERGALALGLALAAALAAGAYSFAGGSIFTLLPATLALGLGTCALLGFWRRAPGLGPAGVAPYVLLHFGVLWIARWLYELSAPGFALLSLVPLAATPAFLAPALRPRTRAALALLGPTLLASLALIVEWSSAPEPYY